MKSLIKTLLAVVGLVAIVLWYMESDTDKTATKEQAEQVTAKVESVADTIADKSATVVDKVKDKAETTTKNWLHRKVDGLFD